jgi:hypothetical protein
MQIGLASEESELLIRKPSTRISGFRFKQIVHYEARRCPQYGECLGLT